MEKNTYIFSQVYTEAYTCPCIRYHPHNATFIAQSNGNYIAIFSSRAPFKLDRYKRYANHSVSGFPIKCNFSQDGNEIVSGSADGYIYFYNHKSSQLLRKIKAFQEPCVDVVFHPQIPNVIASCSWNGEISIFDWHEYMTHLYFQLETWSSTFWSEGRGVGSYTESSYLSTT